MTEQRMLDFLGALVRADEDLPAATADPVRFHVRTGLTIPPKKQMRATNYKVMVWRYAVKDLTSFAAFLASWEQGFSDDFNQRARAAGLIDEKDPANLVIKQSYLGTFPSRSPGGSAINRFNTAWGGHDDRLAIIDKCRVAVPSQLRTPDETWLAAEVGKLLHHAAGNVEVDVLDPTIGF